VIRTNGITRAGCWSHARRKLKEALDTGSTSVAGLLGLVQQLFAVERPINERALTDEIDHAEQLDLRRVARDVYSTSLLEAIFVEAERLERQRSTLPKSKLGKALGYLMSQRQALSAFLGDPRLPIHNNDSERDLRHVAVGRKNWLVFASPRGGEVACRLYSLVLSCLHRGRARCHLDDARQPDRHAHAVGLGRADGPTALRSLRDCQSNAAPAWEGRTSTFHRPVHESRKLDVSGLLEYEPPHPRV